MKKYCWLIQEEIKTQEYSEFKDKLLSKNPENLTNYIEILIKTYPRPTKPDRKV